jgi:hypothetical protein
LRSSWLVRIGRSVAALTEATWNARTRPSRSTSAMTAFLGRNPAVRTVFGLSADERLVNLDHGVGPTKRTSAGRLAHRLADTMGHEPSRLVRDAEHAVHLMARHAFLRSGQEVGSQEPLMQRDLGALENGSDRYRELLAAAVALVHARAMPLALKLRDLLRLAAMLADRAMRPALSFQMLAGYVLVSEDRGSDVEGHGALSLLSVQPRIVAHALSSI